jgi:hypothetical protein
VNMAGFSAAAGDTAEFARELWLLGREANYRVMNAD